MNPLGIIVDIGCVNIVNKYQQKLFYISTICILHNIGIDCFSIYTLSVHAENYRLTFKVVI